MKQIFKIIPLPWEDPVRVNVSDIVPIEMNYLVFAPS